MSLRERHSRCSRVTKLLLALLTRSQSKENIPPSPPGRAGLLQRSSSHPGPIHPPLPALGSPVLAAPVPIAAAGDVGTGARAVPRHWGQNWLGCGGEAAPSQGLQTPNPLPLVTATTQRGSVTASAGRWQVAGRLVLQGLRGHSAKSQSRRGDTGRTTRRTFLSN